MPRSTIWWEKKRSKMRIRCTPCFGCLLCGALHFIDWSVHTHSSGDGDGGGDCLLACLVANETSERCEVYLRRLTCTSNKSWKQKLKAKAETGNWMQCNRRTHTHTICISVSQFAGVQAPHEIYEMCPKIMVHTIINNCLLIDIEQNKMNRCHWGQAHRTTSRWPNWDAFTRTKNEKKKKTKTQNCLSRKINAHD